MQRWRAQVTAVISLVGSISSALAQESGYQIINGTRVFTQIDHAADQATFSNECGSQTISHSDLAAGAIPTDIIPCPRDQSSSPPEAAPAPTPPPKPNLAEADADFAEGQTDMMQRRWREAAEAFDAAAQIYTRQKFGEQSGRYSPSGTDVVAKDDEARCLHLVMYVLDLPRQGIPIRPEAPVTIRSAAPCSASQGRSALVQQAYAMLPGGSGEFGSPPRPPSRAHRVREFIGENCVVVIPKETLIGCGDGKHWWFTQLKASHAPMCPSDFKFTDREPDAPTGVSEGDGPTRLQTCGGPATDVKPFIEVLRRE